MKKNYFIQFFTFLVLLLSINPIFCQTNLNPKNEVAVTATVRSATFTVMLIPQAVVTLSDGNTYDQTTTDLDGIFIFNNVTTGKDYLLSIKTPDFKTYKDTISIDANATGTVDLGTIYLQDITCNPMENLTANVEERDVYLTWDDPNHRDCRIVDNYSDKLTIIKSKNRSVPKGKAKVILEAHDVWGDGTGYQFLLDEDHNTYGTIIPPTEYYLFQGSVSPDFYDQHFEYLIPHNAEPSYTINVISDGEGSVIIPAGLYDWCITNPAPGLMWIASDNGPHPTRADDYEFESGFEYRFIMSRYGGFDGAELITNTFDEENFTYNIYRDEELIASVFETLYTDKEVNSGEHEYCVEIEYPNICTSPLACTTAYIEIDCNPVENLSFTVVGDIVTLTWKQPELKNNKSVVSYNIYKDGEKIETTTETTFTDSDVELGNHTYCVELEFETCVADQVCVDVTIEELICNPIKNLTSEVVDNEVILNWEAPEESNKTSKIRNQNNSTDGLKIIKERKRDIPKGSAKIVLEAHDVWGDGTGYQFLIDADQDTYGTIIPTDDNLFYGEVDEDFYTSNFEYFIPVNAEPKCNTNTIIWEGEGFVIIPAGVYDWCITNPFSDGENCIMYIPSNFGPHPCIADNYEFVGGYEYRFLMGGYDGFDGTELIQTDFDDTNDNPIVSYKIYRNNSLIDTTTELSYTDNNIEPNTEYEYCVEVEYKLCASEKECTEITTPSKINNTSNLAIYPNPANDIINIKGINIAQINIYNNIGKLVETTSKNQIDVSSYSAGVYILNILSKDGENYRSKVVVE